ncbi:MAG: hypothetical protein WBD99_12465 [Thermodesulfobacteriota bacterium]
MRHKFIATTIVVMTFLTFLFQPKINAETISTKEANELRAFLKEKMGNVVPDEAKIEVSGYEKTPLSGFKQGRFKVTTSKGSGDVPFLISDDGKYLIFGEPVDTRTFQDLPFGMTERKIQIGTIPIPVMMTKDGRYLILGEHVDTSTFQEVPFGMKEGNIQTGSGTPIPIIMTKDGRFLILGGELIDLKAKPTK